MKRYLCILLILCILFTAFPVSAFAADKEQVTPLKVNGEYYYYSEILKAIEPYIFSYDESWFDESSFVYQHDLAKMSLQMAQSSIDGVQLLDGKRSLLITNMYDKLGFEYVDEHWTDDENSKDTVFYPDSSDNSSGYSIAKKTVKKSDGGEYTLIALMPRSIKYMREWAGNFNIGAGREHYGFALAADKIVDAFTEYMEESAITGEVKIWIAGYSRGAAVANVLGQRLNKLASQNKLFGIKESGIFTYSFECPQTVMTTAPSFKEKTYNNIFSVINSGDIVAKVAPSRWDYTRYGITLNVPTPETSAEFSKQQDKLEKNCAELLLYAGCSQKEANSLAAENCRYMRSLVYGGQTEFANTVVTRLANWFGAYKGGINGAKHYTKFYENRCMDLGRAIGDQEGALSYAVKFLLVTPTFIPAHIPLAAELALNVKSIGSSHYAERCLMWLESLNGIEDFCDTTTRKLIVNGDADLAVYDSKDKLVAKINNDKPKELAGSTVMSFCDENGQKVVMLPMDESYRLDISAKGSGTISYMAEECDVQSGEVNELVAFNDVAVSGGDTLSAQIGEKFGSYTLCGDSGKAIEASTVKSGDAINEYAVIVEQSEGHELFGEGVYTEGEYAQLSVGDNGSKEGFKGWYIGSKLLSTEQTYRFRVEKDCKVKAVFSDDKGGEDNTFGGFDFKGLTHYFGNLNSMLTSAFRTFLSVVTAPARHLSIFSIFLHKR